MTKHCSEVLNVYAPDIICGLLIFIDCELRLEVRIRKASLSHAIEGRNVFIN